MIRTEIFASIVKSILDYVSSPDCMEAHRVFHHFVRKRKLSMKDVVLYLFYSNKASMNQNLANIRLDLPELSFPEVSKQAISKARQGINPTLFRDLYNLSVEQFYKNIDSRKTWHGYHLFAVDGSKFELPNSQSNFDFFGEMFGYPNPEKRYTAGLASIIYDVLDDYIVHASFSPFLSSERAAAEDHLKNLEALNIYQDSIVIFDRGYYSEKFMRYCISHGHLCLMRLKEGIKMAKSCKGDSFYILNGNENEGTEDIKVRVIEVILDDGSKEYLATNLFDTSITRDMFRELYFYRWPVEVKYLELKQRLQIESFNGTTTTSVLQEFYLNLLFANLTSLVKNQADEEIEAGHKPANKYRYQANRSFIIGQLKKILPRILCGVLNLTVALNNLIRLSIKNRSQLQPNRSSKRGKIKKGRTHFNNMKVSF